MKKYGPNCCCLAAALALLAAFAVWALPATAQGGAKGMRREMKIAQNAQPAREEHLQRWMQSHSAMSLAEQQRALQSEPGFRELPPQVQQNRLNMLARLYNMNPQQRDRILDRTEILERMAPAQRQQWRDAVQRLNAVPPQRRRILASAILQLRDLPGEQRQQVLNSPAYVQQFSPEERHTMGTLLTAEPSPDSRTPRQPYPSPPPPAQ